MLSNIYFPINLLRIGSLTCVDPQLLTLKSYSQSLITSLRDCVDILQRTFAADCGFRPASGTSESKQSTGSTFVSHIKKKY